MKLSAYAREIGVTYKTAYRWWKAGKLDAYQLDTGTVIVRDPLPKSARGVALYARVSSVDQKSDLEHRDRGTRFGFIYIEQLLAMQGRRLEVVFPKDTDDDLVNDFVSIITSMAARISGRRNSRRKAERIKQCVEEVMKQEV